MRSVGLNEELELWLEALVVAEDACSVDGERDPADGVGYLLGLTCEFNFYCGWYNSICDEIERSQK